MILPHNHETWNNQVLFTNFLVVVVVVVGGGGGVKIEATIFAQKIASIMSLFKAFISFLNLFLTFPLTNVHKVQGKFNEVKENYILIQGHGYCKCIEFTILCASNKVKLLAYFL